MIASSNIQRITLRRVCDKRSQVYWHATPRLLLKIYHSGTFLRAREIVINVCLASDTDSGFSCCPKDSKSNHVPKLSLKKCSSQNLPGVQVTAHTHKACTIFVCAGLSLGHRSGAIGPTSQRDLSYLNNADDVICLHKRLPTAFRFGVVTVSQSQVTGTRHRSHFTRHALQATETTSQKSHRQSIILTTYKNITPSPPLTPIFPLHI